MWCGVADRRLGPLSAPVSKHAGRIRHVLWRRLSRRQHTIVPQHEDGQPQAESRRSNLAVRLEGNLAADAQDVDAVRVVGVFVLEKRLSRLAGWR